MTDEEKAKPVSNETTMPPSPNPDLGRQLLAAASSGDPNKALDSLVAAGVMTPEARAGMLAEAEKEKEGQLKLAYQIAQNTEAVRFMAHAIDNQQNALNALRGDMSRKSGLTWEAAVKYWALLGMLNSTIGTAIFVTYACRYIFG